MFLCVCVCAAGEVPGSAVLVFDIELIDMEEGLPEGYMFIWNEDVSPDLFSDMDMDKNKLVEHSEVRLMPIWNIKAYPYIKLWWQAPKVVFFFFAYALNLPSPLPPSSFVLTVHWLHHAAGERG